MSGFFHDIHLGLRTLLRQPLFTCAAVATLALGIGANTAVFSVVDAVLLRPLPYPHSERLVYIFSRSPQLDESSISYPDYLDWRVAQHSFTDLALERMEPFTLSPAKGDRDEPESVQGFTVSANYLPVLGVAPALGRNFTGQEDTPGGPHAVIMTDALWRRRFGSNPDIIGKSLLLDGVSRQITGVLPPAVRFPNHVDLIVPVGDGRADANLLNRAVLPGFGAVGRLKPGATLQSANADLDGIARELGRRYPQTNTGRLTSVRSLLDVMVGEYCRTLYLLTGAVFCVLLIACANVANLQFARMAMRTRELAVRAALGASRWRLTRQLLTESALLGLLGGTLGVVLAFWAVDGIVALSPAYDVRFRETHLDPRALAFTSLVAVGAGLLAGAWPAWRVSRVAALSVALHEGGGRNDTIGVGQQRSRALLVITQVALATVLLAGAGLTLEALRIAQNSPLGFNPRGIVLCSVSLPRARYETKEKQARFCTELLARSDALPGTMGAGLGVVVPFSGIVLMDSVHRAGAPPDLAGQQRGAMTNYVSPDYFKVLGIPLLRGRSFGPQDTGGTAPVAIVDEDFVRRFFPGEDPLGQQVELGDRLGSGDPAVTIVGVVPKSRNFAPGIAPIWETMPEMHLAFAQVPKSFATFLIRAAPGDPLRLADSLRHVVSSLDGDLPVSYSSTLEREIADSLAPRRMTMVLLGAFAVVALALASIGLYGVMALSVTQRTRELGIRLALGAQPATVLGLIMRQGVGLVGIGLLVGLVAAVALGRLLASVLYGVGTGDLLLLLSAVTVALTGASLLACWLPARRATRLDPVDALRGE